MAVSPKACSRMTTSRRGTLPAASGSARRPSGISGATGTGAETGVDTGAMLTPRRRAIASIAVCVSRSSFPEAWIAAEKSASFPLSSR